MSTVSFAALTWARAVDPNPSPNPSSNCTTQDLLQPRAVELALRESPEGALEVPGLREVEVCSLEDCLGLLQLGDRNRCSSTSYLHLCV